MATVMAGKTVKVTHRAIMENKTMRKAKVTARKRRVLYGVVNELGCQIIDLEQTRPVVEVGNNPSHPLPEKNLPISDPRALSLEEIFYFAQLSRNWLMMDSSLTTWAGFYSADFK